MKIVLLLTVGIERPSGRRYFHLARELARRGHAVRILALHPDLAACDQRRFVQDGVEDLQQSLVQQIKATHNEDLFSWSLLIKEIEKFKEISCD